MPDSSPDLIALLGSRICHDLISPIGAIGNGVELLLMSGLAPGPELTLIEESVSNASARIRFFRIAFGAAPAGQRIARTEIRPILEDMTRGGRLRIDWQAGDDNERRDVKLAFLALQCLETALPYGGHIRISETDGNWQVAAQATKVMIDRDLWTSLTGEGSAGDLPPSHVQFILFPGELARRDRRLALSLGDTAIAMNY